MKRKKQERQEGEEKKLMGRVESPGREYHRFQIGEQKRTLGGWRKKVSQSRSKRKAKKDLPIFRVRGAPR